MEKQIIGNAELYLGDCSVILPTLPVVDLLLTDPPYGINEAAGKNKRLLFSTPQNPLEIPELSASLKWNKSQVLIQHGFGNIFNTFK